MFYPQISLQLFFQLFYIVVIGNHTRTKNRPKFWFQRLKNRQSGLSNRNSINRNSFAYFIKPHSFNLITALLSRFLNLVKECTSSLSLHRGRGLGGNELKMIFSLTKFLNAPGTGFQHAWNNRSLVNSPYS